MTNRCHDTDDTMAVDRCICRKITFAEALAAARTLGVRTVGGLQRHVDVGTGCGRCIPYMQRSLISGEVDLPVLDERECERLMELADVRLLGEDQ
jgi:bacterioferritin-associated ferredoxin